MQLRRRNVKHNSGKSVTGYATGYHTFVVEIYTNNAGNVRVTNTEARLRNYCCRGKAISITYFCVWASACSFTNPVCIAPQYCHLRPLWLHHIFRHYLINGTIFGKKVTEHKTCFVILHNSYLKQFSFYEFSEILTQMQKSLQVKYPLFLSYFKETLIFKTDFRHTHTHAHTHTHTKGSHTKILIFIKIRPMWIRVLPCGWTAKSLFSQVCERT